MAETMSKFIVALSILISFEGFGQFWIQKSSFPGLGRHRSTGCATSHRGYLGLGHHNGAGVDISFKDWWEYDPASDTWTQRADFPVSTHGALAFVVDNCPVVGGGSALSTQFYKFNPNTNSWAPIANCILSNPGDSQAFSVNNCGFVYQANQLAKYDPQTDAWTLCAQGPISFATWSCSFAIEGSGFIKSGAQLWEYKPLHDQWIQRASFPGVCTNGSSAFAIEQHGYITCGYVGGLGNVTDQVWSFHPASNTWKQEIEFEGTNRRFPVAFAIHNRGYFGTGTNGINFNDFWQFNPTDNTIGISEHGLEFNVFPNPANEFVSVKSSSIHLEDLTLTIRNIEGREMHHEKLITNLQTIPLIELPTGVYFLQIADGNHIIHQQKLIKQ